MSKGTIRPLRCADRSMSGEVVYYRIIYNCYRVSFPWRSVIGTFTLFFSHSAFRFPSEGVVPRSKSSRKRAMRNVPMLNRRRPRGHVVESGAGCPRFSILCLHRQRPWRGEEETFDDGPAMPANLKAVSLLRTVRTLPSVVVFLAPLP